jgi:hypothetical protein
VGHYWQNAVSLYKVSEWDPKPANGMDAITTKSEGCQNYQKRMKNVKIIDYSSITSFIYQ